MTRLVGRESELKFLNSVCEDPSIRSCAIFGRRRVGKTTLLKKMAEGREILYIQFDKGIESVVVVSALQQIGVIVDKDRMSYLSKDLFDVLDLLCRERPRIIVLDELPYLLESSVSAYTSLQRFVDWTVTDTGSTLIGCGSQMSVMQDLLTKESNPLYGRFVTSLEVRPLRFQDVCMMHPSMSDVDKISMFMAFGGMPTLHLSTRDTFREFIEDMMLADGTPFMGLAMGIIPSELRNHAACEDIIRIIASGTTSQRDIARSMGMSAAGCKSVLDKLERLGFVARRVPMLGAPKKPIEYFISDSFLALWYTVFDGISTFRMPDDLHMRFDWISGRLDTFLGHRFELFCMDYVSTNYPCKEIGSWWGVEDDGEGNYVGVDIDLVAKVFGWDIRATVVGECKFRKRPAKYSDLKRLERRAAMRGEDTATMMMFSAGGFERQLVAEAQRHAAVLIGMDELMGRSPAPPLSRATMMMDTYECEDEEDDENEDPSF